MLVEEMSRTIERRLELWEVSFVPKQSKSRSSELADLFTQIMSLPFQAETTDSTESELVRELRDEKDILVVDCRAISPDRIEGVFGKGRDVDIPGVRKGKRKKKIKLAPGEYIEYPCHFIIFEEGLVVFERNPNGPSPAALGPYIEQKCRNFVTRVRVDRVPRGEFLERFKRISDTRSITLRLGIRAIRRFAHESDDGLWDGLLKEYEMSGFANVTIRFSLAREPGGMRFRWFRKIPEIIVDPEASRDLLRLEINARMQDSGEVEIIRLLKKASMEKTVRFKVKGDDKNLDAEEVYRAIQNIYVRFKRIMEGKENAEYLDLVQEELFEK